MCGCGCELAILMAERRVGPPLADVRSEQTLRTARVGRFRFADWLAWLFAETSRR